MEDNPITVIWSFLDKQNVPGGVYTYGGIDEKNCGPVIAYEPLSATTYWQFKVGRATVDKSTEGISLWLTYLSVNNPWSSDERRQMR